MIGKKSKFDQSSVVFRDEIKNFFTNLMQKKNLDEKMKYSILIVFFLLVVSVFAVPKASSKKTQKCNCLTKVTKKIVHGQEIEEKYPFLVNILSTGPNSTEFNSMYQ